MRSSKRFFAAIVAVAFAVCGAGTAIALSSDGSAEATATSGSSVSPTGGGDPAVAAQFAVLSRPQTSSDMLPATDAQVLQQSQAWADPIVSDARKVAASDGRPAYLVPSMTGVCVINANEDFCTTSQKLAGAAVVDLCSPTLPSGQLELEWILPDGASNVSLGMSDNTTKTLPKTGYNVYITRLPFDGASPIPTTIQWDFTGQHHSVNTPIPANAQGETCARPNPRPIIPSASTVTTG